MTVRRETTSLNLAKLRGVTFVNQYVVIKYLGKGANGRVFLCLDMCDNRLYAVKVSPPALAYRDNQQNHLSLVVCLGTIALHAFEGSQSTAESMHGYADSKEGGYGVIKGQEEAQPPQRPQAGGCHHAHAAPQEHCSPAGGYHPHAIAWPASRQLCNGMHTAIAL